ncbi:hypothetical protein QEH56_14575 [Pelagicoccus enzymogenes]|uniref:hypothetical protein n=1 Tax=Pelagicoccus enzymogenes TaxID=2773457 RepID=UPI0028105DB8|nr:hypothetical protein [Pelagicoccus enzymogenes]MDQ8199388.1 hypothetical protein [Pelagicoccus enzymogenes]
MSIIVKVENGEMKVKAPFNSAFNWKAKDLAGKWKKPYWCFPLELEEQVRSICLRFHGDDGTGTVQTVVYDLVALDEMKCLCGPITVNGRILLTARGNYGGAKMGDGVSLIEGSKGSGGSQNNWFTWLEKGSILKVLTVPLALKDEFAGAARTQGFEVKLVTAENKLVAELKDEKRRLLARLEEIDSELLPLESSIEEGN